MTNQNSKAAGSIPTTWELRTYDVWGNARDGYDVNDVYSAGSIELRIPQTRHNIGVSWHVCRNPQCKENYRRVYHSVLPALRVPANSQNGAPEMPHCPDCGHLVMLESQEFISAYPTDRQIKRAFGTSCRIETDGDDIHITVNRSRDGYPIGEMLCVSHESLSPVRKLEDWSVIVGNVGTVSESGINERNARLLFNTYVDRSKSHVGRCAGEPVTLLCDGDIKEEYQGTLVQTEEN